MVQTDQQNLGHASLDANAISCEIDKPETACLHFDVGATLVHSALFNFDFRSVGCKKPCSLRIIFPDVWLFEHKGSKQNSNSVQEQWSAHRK